MSDEPKCVRLMLTAIYADGTSVLLDVKAPDTCEIEIVNGGFDTVGVAGSYKTFIPETILELNLKTKIKKEEPAIISYFPTDKAEVR